MTKDELIDYYKNKKFVLGDYTGMDVAIENLWILGHTNDFSKLEGCPPFYTSDDCIIEAHAKGFDRFKECSKCWSQFMM